MKTLELLGQIWNILYANTNIPEENLPEICEKLLKKLEESGWKMAKEKVDVLFDVFAGEHISIILDKEVEQVRQTETHIETLKSSISISGYAVDMDDDYIYLGYEPGIISQAIKKTFIVHIEITNPNNDILSSIELPKDEKEYN